MADKIVLGMICVLAVWRAVLVLGGPRPVWRVVVVLIKLAVNLLILAAIIWFIFWRAGS